MITMRDVSEIKEELVRDLTLLKLKRHFSEIGEEEFIKGLVAVYENSFYSIEIENLAFINFVEFINIADEIIETKGNIKVVLDKEVHYKTLNEEGKLKCDGYIITADSLEVVKFISDENEINHGYNNIELQLLAVGILNETGCIADIKELVLSIIQSNILIASRCEYRPDKLLHDSEYSLM